MDNEREAIVAWLTDEANAIRKHALRMGQLGALEAGAAGVVRASVLDMVAVEISRGAHLKDTPQ
jgi:hypothetical protein